MTQTRWHWVKRIGGIISLGAVVLGGLAAVWGFGSADASLRLTVQANEQARQTLQQETRELTAAMTELTGTTQMLVQRDEDKEARLRRLESITASQLGAINNELKNHTTLMREMRTELRALHNAR